MNSFTQHEIGAPFMLMECLPGNTGVDLNRDNARGVPSKYKFSFYKEMARLQVGSSWFCNSPLLALTKTDGNLIDNVLQDRGYCSSRRRYIRRRPSSQIGGPFNTATEYLTAWAEAAQFPNLLEAEYGCCGVV